MVGVCSNGREPKGANTTTDTYSYSSTSNRLDQVASNDGSITTNRTLQYDANGNVITNTKADGTVHSLTYNNANRYSVLSKDNTPKATYIYNALGQRTGKTSVNPTQDEHYHYDSAGMLLAVTKPTSGTAIREYIYLDTIKVAVLVGNTTAANQPPSVSITTPISGSNYVEGSNVTFTATASDTEDGDITGNIQWLSSLDGALSTTGAFNTAALSIGTHTITASVTDSGGLTATQTKPITITGGGSATVINLNNHTLSSYGGSNQDVTGTATIEGNGALRIVGNRWKTINFPYTITPNTVLEFDFSSSAQGEIHGIGFDTDTGITDAFTFQLYGTQHPLMMINNYRNYPGDGSTKHYVIPVGQHYTGAMSYLYFIMDHDVNSPTGESRFSNIKVYEQ